MTSSISSVAGFVGQFNYAASNQFLDSIASHRRANGLPGLSFNFGVLGDYAGMSAESTETETLMKIMRSHGLYSMSLPSALHAMERAILHGATQRMSANVDWSLFLQAYPHLLRDRAFVGLENRENDSGISSRSVYGPPGVDLCDAVVDILRAGLAKIVGVDTEEILITEKISQFGFDSITMTQIRSLILQEFRVSYAVMKLFQGPSYRRLRRNWRLRLATAPRMA